MSPSPTLALHHRWRIARLASWRKGFVRGGITNICYELAMSDAVRIDLFDVNGRHIRRLIDEPQRGGRHGVVWDGRAEDGRALAGGIYYVRLRTSDTLQSRAVIMVK